MRVAPPRNRPSEIVLLALLTVFLLPFVFMTPLAPADYSNLYNGVRFIQGQVVYRDFFELIGPVSHWMAGVLFTFVAPSLLAARLLLAGLLLLSGWLIHRLACRLGVGPWLALLPALALPLCLYRLYPVFNHHWVVLPFVLGAWLAGMHGVETGRRRWWAAAGAMAALALLTVQTDGLVTLATLGGTIMVLAVLGGVTWREAGRAAGALAAGTAVVLGAASAVLASQQALGEAFYHMWMWNLQHYKQAGGPNDARFLMDLPDLIAPHARPWVNQPFWYGQLFHVAFLYAVVPLTALAAAAWGLGLGLRRLTGGGSPSPREGQRGLVALAGVAALPLLLSGRPDIVHVAFYAVPGLLLVTLGAELWRRDRREPAQALLAWLPSVAIAGFVATGAMLQAQDMREHPQAWLPSDGGPDGRMADSPLMRFLRQNTTPADRLVSLPVGGVHYFYGRPAGIRYNFLSPPEDRYNSEAEFEAVMAEVARSKPKFVLLTPAHIDPAGYLRLADRLAGIGYKRLERSFETRYLKVAFPVVLFEAPARTAR